MTNIEKIAEVLMRGELVVMPSDTIYGIMARALDETAVARLHQVRGRAVNQGFIVLADSVETVARLVDLRPEVLARLKNIWAKGCAPTSVILAADESKETWLTDTHFDRPTICFRVPNNRELQDLLKKTGPLCAPSANLPDQLPARNVAEARTYFGGKVALYVDGGECEGQVPSRIIKFRRNGTVETVRADGDAHPEDFVITRRRKLYNFARFDEYSTCFHFDEWLNSAAHSELVKNLAGSDPAKVVVEVGAGSALFSVELAQRYPERTFIAIDIKGDRLYQGAREADKLGLENVYFVRADIARITEIVPPHSVQEIWLTFPDPWPPKSDARHRLTAPRYLEYYSQVLAGSYPA
jgi:tRNA threonylcarbamoyl adenosine modification protein (Sua5/YciO/YrdC/YwlC family)